MNIYDLKYIETPRLLIRPVQMGDELEINAAINRSLSALQRWMPWAKDPSLKTTQEFVKRVVSRWAARNSIEFPMVAIHKEHNKIISVSGFNERSDLTKPFFEIGYWINADYQGQGFVTELVNALTRYALKELNATRVQISMQVDNEKSIAVATRLGFKQEGIMKNYSVDCLSNEPVDSFLYSCCDVNSLPPLNVSWELNQKHSESENLVPSSDQLLVTSPEQFNLRSATIDDVKKMVSLSMIKRLNYEKAEPVFWRKAEDAEIQQERYFKKIINDEKYVSLIAEKKGHLLGFIIGETVNTPEVYNPGGLTCIVDDFCTELNWQQVGDRLFEALIKEAIHKGATQVIVVCGNHDVDKRDFLDGIGCRVVSNWFYKEIQ